MVTPNLQNSCKIFRERHFVVVFEMSRRQSSCEVSQDFSRKLSKIYAGISSGQKCIQIENVYLDGLIKWWGQRSRSL